MRFIYVSIPRGTNSGTYPINYQVNAQGNANLNGADRVNVQIIAVAGAELSTTDKPYVLLAGDEYKITTQLKIQAIKLEPFVFMLRTKMVLLQTSLRALLP